MIRQQQQQKQQQKETRREKLRVVFVSPAARGEFIESQKKRA